LVGLLAVVDFLVAIIVFAKWGLVEDLGVGLLAVQIGALAVAEAACAIRPSQQRLARADRLVFIAAATFLALGLVGGVAMAAGSP
jgi:hypothetical protein